MNHEAIPIRAEAQTPGADFCLEARYLKVAGITPFTSIDFPGKLAAVAFLQGCPWQCIYCQNPWMQSRAFAPDLEHSSWEELEKLLSRRKGLLDGVVFSGGEPLTDPALKSAIEEVKSLGMAVGLHTSGSYPRHLKEVIGLVDWVGLDVKAPPETPRFLKPSRSVRGAPQRFAKVLRWCAQAAFLMKRARRRIRIFSRRKQSVKLPTGSQSAAAKHTLCRFSVRRRTLT